VLLTIADGTPASAAALVIGLHAELLALQGRAARALAGRDPSPVFRSMRRAR